MAAPPLSTDYEVGCRFRFSLEKSHPNNATSTPRAAPIGPTEPSSREASHRLSSSSSRLDVCESLDKVAFAGTRDVSNLATTTRRRNALWTPVMPTARLATRVVRTETVDPVGLARNPTDAPRHFLLCRHVGAC